MCGTGEERHVYDLKPYEGKRLAYRRAEVRAAGSLCRDLWSHPLKRSVARAATALGLAAIAAGLINIFSDDVLVVGTCVVVFGVGVVRAGGHTWCGTPTPYTFH